MLSRSSSRLSRCISQGSSRVVFSRLNKVPNSLVEITKVRQLSSKAVDSERPSSTQTLNENIYRQLPPALQTMSLLGKIVMVSGGARGLGHSMARACAEAGAKAIILLDVNQKDGEEAAAKLYKDLGKTIPVSFHTVDVRNEEEINKSIEQVVKDHGLPNVLINAAGIADSNLPAEKYDTKKFARLIDINLNGSFYIAQAVGKRLIEAKKTGSIILIGSMSGSIVNYPQEQCAYNASKAGVIMLGKSLAAEWAKFGVRVNTISPGYMDTVLNNDPALDAQKSIWKNLTPQARLGKISDLDGLAVLLASDASLYMTGSNIIIDGGYTLY